MFVSHEKVTSKKLFQKPNILRKNPKPVSTTKLNETSQLTVPITKDAEQISPEQNNEKNTKHRCSKPCHSIKKPPQRIWVDSYICDEHKNPKFDELNESTTFFLPNSPVNALEIISCNEEGKNLNSEVSPDFGWIVKEEGTMQSEFFEDGIYITGIEDSKSRDKMGYMNSDDSNKIVIEPYGDNTKDFSIRCSEELKKAFSDNILLTTEFSNICGTLVEGATTTEQSNTNDVISNYNNFKCDVPNCSKIFINEGKLKKHKNTHNKQSGQRPIKQAIECPVKNFGTNKNESCGKVYLQREELLKHLNEDHTLDDASHRCELCNRRFFWLSGLRAHGRTHASGRSRTYLCHWQGCGRVFLQACRLKEHTRAHTGDRPYACRYPNCGWSFRTASKLVRHARQHTGERKHNCTACGRAFLRAEHLREHAIRHTQPHHRPRHACTVQGCEQTFTNMSTLYFHMKKVHRKNENKESKTISTDSTSTSENEPGWPTIENVFSLCDDEGETSGPEWHAARTHCTWPLATNRAPIKSPSPTLATSQDQDDTDGNDEAYILKSDIQVEMFESSDSNVYTVRSDLFLHGNVLHSEDSEGGETPGAVAGTSEDGLELVLLPPPLDLDPPPTSHLMQEELMYADAVVDESSFQVLLLNGDEIN